VYICMSNEGLISIVFFYVTSIQNASAHKCIFVHRWIYIVILRVHRGILVCIYIYIYKRIYSRVLIYSKWHKYFLIIFCLCFPLAEENRRLFFTFDRNHNYTSSFSFILYIRFLNYALWFLFFFFFSLLINLLREILRKYYLS